MLKGLPNREAGEADLKLQLNGGHVAIQENYLRKIADELISNAVKFSTPGTELLVKSETNDTTVTFQVVDHGHGLSMEQIANIGAYMQFDRKFHEQQGSGLGLTISKRLIEIHNGNLSVESEPLKGTYVTVRFQAIYPPSHV